MFAAEKENCPSVSRVFTSRGSSAANPKVSTRNKETHNAAIPLANASFYGLLQIPLEDFTSRRR